MTKILVIQGAGMNMRGRAQIEIFGTTTLDEINDAVRRYAEELGVEVEIFHSNIEGEVVNALYAAHDGDVDAAVINPSGYTTGTGPLLTAITQVRFPVIEVHASNPSGRALSPTCSRLAVGWSTASASLGTIWRCVGRRIWPRRVSPRALLPRAGLKPALTCSLRPGARWCGCPGLRRRDPGRASPW